jgi:creatinine amidohydrolase
MRIEELNWMDVKNYLEREDRLILVLGTCEQHGYLSLMTDIKIPMALADSVSKQTGVLIAPPLNFGVSPGFMGYPGTLSIRASTFFLVVEDILRAAHTHGFRRIFILNGHGGNDAVCAHLTELANELPDLRLIWYSWWKADVVKAVAQKYSLKPAHANWLEAFSFTRVSELPAGEKAIAKTESVQSAVQTRVQWGDGVEGGKYFVDDNVMQEMFNAVVEDVIRLLKFE